MKTICCIYRSYHRVRYNACVIDLDTVCSQGLMKTLGISARYDDERIQCRMSINDTVTQPFGALHGGATAALMETGASLNALDTAPAGFVPVGVSLQINHYRAARQGVAICDVEEVFRGRSQVAYRCVITNKAGQLLADGHVGLVWKAQRTGE